MAGGVQALLPRVPSQPGEYLCDPAHKEAARPVCLCALGEAVVCRWQRPRNAAEKSKRLAYLIYDKHGM